MSFFKPEDFNDGLNVLPQREVYADKANRILTERGVRVYAQNYLGAWVDAKEQATPDGKVRNPTHQALLVCIEELPKAECEHVPHGEILRRITFVEHGKTVETECGKCGIKLRAKWEPA